MAMKFLLECKEYKFITLRPLEIVVLILGKFSLISSGRNDFLKENPGGSSIDSDFTTWYIFRKKQAIYSKVSQDVPVADLGFSPGGGANSQSGCAYLLFLPKTA